MVVAATEATKRPSGRLDAAAWIEAGLNTLAGHGIDAVRIEPLAKTLGVTKGSFYWHFKDRPALLEAMLVAWRKRATFGVIQRLERQEISPRARLEKLLELPFAGARSEAGASLELAIRLWCKQDSAAQAMVDEVDELRLGYIRSLLIACGVSEAHAGPRAYMAYLQIIGESLVRVGHAELRIGDVVKMLLGSA